MIQSRLRVELEKVARRRRRLRVLGSWSVIWLLAALAGIALVWSSRGAAPFSPWSAAWLVGLSLLAAVAACLIVMRTARDERAVARLIEARHPALQSRLLTALEQHPDERTGRFGYLQETVIKEALDHSRRHTWNDAISNRKLFAARVAHFFSLAAFGAVLLAMVSLAVSRPNRPGAATSPDAVLATVGRYRVEIKPGHVELERGASLVVMARFEGELPPDAELLLESASGKSERLPMSRSLDDPLFGARVPSIDEDLTYRVAFERERTEPFRVTVFEYPALVQADARLTFPGYTSMEEKLVEDTRRISAVEGTRLTWICRLNKPVSEARLESGDDTLPLAADPADANVYTATLTLTESRRYRLHLKDEQGRANKEPPEFVVNVLPNRPPEIEIAWPSRDAQVSPLEEFDVEATAWDDFGLARYGVVFSHAGADEQEIVLGEGGSPKEKRSMAHQIDLEKLGAEPDDLLSYYFFAEDRGPDGQVRRTASDMFFAEVRRYEEVFRQGEQPPGGEQQQQQQQQSGQNAQQAEQLAELQKQIITATWNVIRRNRPDRLTPQFAPDVRLLVESQVAAQEQLEELAGNVQDAESRGHVEEVKRHMTGASQQLMRAVDETSPEPLRSALPEEQAAYQGLLKLRAREFQVMRSNSRQQQQSSSSGGASSAMQRQLDQLELKDEENRYETQRTAQDQQENQQQREVRQALNRLKELARRQEDLNKQLQELQSALEQAQSEEEKEEIRRRLERLREEEQQMLRDLDELRERMDQPQNQQEMAESQERLAETRENIRQASEALEQGRVSQALAEGTRAQRQFEELRDEFRRKAAGQFDEEMREMREAARELEERERELADRIQQDREPGERRSLRDPGQKQDTAQGFQDQKERLNELLNQMENVVREAEQPEPLLADQLYDTVRNARQQRIEDALDAARQLAQAGLTDQAAPAEEAARAGIENLRQGVERAAQSVLGDETESLERARETVDDLAQQLDREAQAHDPQEREAQELAPRDGAENPDSQVHQASFDSENPGPQDSQSQQQGQNQQGQNQQGQNQQGQNQQGQNQQGQNQQGQNQQGQNQQGQNQQGQNQQGQNQQGQNQSGRGQRDPRSLRGGPQDPRDGQGNPQLDDIGGSRAFDHQGAPMNPLTGENFREWSDQLRDVEEMLEDPELRAEAAEIRDRARGLRVEYKRHSQEPNWDLVRMGVIKPLNDLRDRIAEELIRRQAGEVLAPIDRDPVPPQFADPVRRYYEELGRGTQ